MMMPGPTHWALLVSLGDLILLLAKGFRYTYTTSPWANSLLVLVLDLAALLTASTVAMMNASMAASLIWSSLCTSAPAPWRTRVLSKGSSLPKDPGMRMFCPSCLWAGEKPLLLYSLFLACSTACTTDSHSCLLSGLTCSRTRRNMFLANPPCLSVLPCWWGALAPMVFTTAPASLILVLNAPRNSRPWSITTISGIPKILPQAFINFHHTCSALTPSKGSSTW